MTTLRSESVLERTAAPERRRPEREPWFDNIKMTLVVLVVVGHAWALLPAARGSDWAYDFLYAWHMPAFAIITGYFSRSMAWTPEKLIALVRTVAVPYVVFEAALAWFRDRFGGVELHELFTDPHWPLWYLVALFVWRLLAPGFLRMPPAVAVGLAVVTSLVAGAYAGDTLDTARIFGMLPFFVLGLHLGRRQWAALRSRPAVPVALFALVGIAVLAGSTDSWVSTEWFYYRSTYAAMGEDGAHAVLLRSGVLAIGLVGALAMFAVVPRGRSWFSRLGAATIVVYLFHGFFVLLARYRGFPDWAGDHAALAFPLVTVTAVLLALLLAAPPVASRLNHLVDPVGWLQRRVNAAGPRSG